MSKKIIPRSHDIAALAINPSLFPVWDPAEPFPMPDEMPDLDIITQVTVTRAKPGGYNYLHEATVQFHNGKFYACFANNPNREYYDHGELIRGCVSEDGLHWSEPEIWVESPALGSTSFNHPLLFEHNGTLYGFFVAWYAEHRPVTEIFILNDKTGKWIHQADKGIKGFVPFGTPQQMPDGNWLISGEKYWYDAAVLISSGDDLTDWQLITVPRSDDVKVLFPESAVINFGDGHLLDFCRPYRGNHPLMPLSEKEIMYTAPIAESFDGGNTWTKLKMSNFPLAESQPFSGRLSNGQAYLITDNLEDDRTLLSIAVTEPNGVLFKRIFKLRHQQWPKRRQFYNAIGKGTEWSYPNAFEYDKKLYIIYSQGKEDCVMSIVPIDALAVKQR